MADNGTAASGPTIAWDDIGGIAFQRVKWTIGADGTATDVSAGTGVDGTGVPRVTLATNVGLPAGEARIGTVGGTTVVKDVTLTLDTAAYASGYVLAATQQVDGALRITNGTGLLQNLTLIDQNDQKVALTVYFLNSNVTMGTENAAPSISDANALFVLGFVDVAVADYKDLGGVAVANPIISKAIPLIAASGTDDIYVAVVNGSGTPTYTATGVTLRLGILQD